jgi:hypothetical protein
MPNASASTLSQSLQLSWKIPPSSPSCRRFLSAVSERPQSGPFFSWTPAASLPQFDLLQPLSPLQWPVFFSCSRTSCWPSLDPLPMQHPHFLMLHVDHFNTGAVWWSNSIRSFHLSRNALVRLRASSLCSGFCNESKKRTRSSS